ncbi:DeoR/GlpR transcriptional regulator [Catenovulum sp. SM1970]|uniref:DeoR/GlpR family DNA-binding transcription regulator n=1 Tax=Marinifaba aquimaris TaxID=2741323 RepID=UPI00157495ED|nr:DeoR/GlpR family DNA-binding transcription regulator [Marinifaba aquimaris]NTS76260.1 DeoR/GlpR transcriptional regulator [Marinifaba aquimaris]
MLLAERQNYILEQLNTKGRVSATDLANELAVSEDTVRRDLNKLSDMKLLRRVHGGALPLQLEVPDYADRLEKRNPNKQKLAREAVKYIEPNQTIMLNSGETCRYIAMALPRDLPLTVVSACPLIACELAHHDKIDVILLGGTFFKPALRCLGTIAADMIRKMRFDICFMGLCALHPERGFSAKYIEEAEIMRVTIEQADRTIVMGGHTRLGKVSSHQVVSIHELDLLITNDLAEQTVLDAFGKQGLEIVQIS